MNKMSLPTFSSFLELSSTMKLSNLTLTCVNKCAKHFLMKTTTPPLRLPCLLSFLAGAMKNTKSFKIVISNSLSTKVSVRHIRSNVFK